MTELSLRGEMEVVDGVDTSVEDGLLEIEAYLQRYTGDDLLTAIDKAASVFAASIAPENTITAYSQDWGWWTRFCADTRLPLLTISPGVLVAFVAWLARYRRDDDGRFAMTTIERRLTGTIAGLRLRLGVAQVPKGIGRNAYVVIGRLRKRLAAEGVVLGRTAAPPLWPEQLARIIDCLPADKLISGRDEAMLRVMFAAAMRTAEVSALLASDMIIEARGLRVRIRDSKAADGVQYALLPYEHDYPQVCPVLAWERWRAATALPPDGPAFPRMDRHGNVYNARISPESVGDRVTDLAQRAGLSIRFTGHSARRGHASAARRGGADNTTIERSGRWAPQSRALHRYLADEDQWTASGARGLMVPKNT